MLPVKLVLVEYQLLLSSNNEVKSNLNSPKEVVNKLSRVSSPLSENTSKPSSDTIFSFSQVVKANPVVLLMPRNSSQTRKDTLIAVNLKLDPNCVGVENIRGA